MKAVRFIRHGKPDALTIEEIADEFAGFGQVAVRVEAASINLRDGKDVHGLMARTVLSRTPGRDIAGGC
jgi:NADPH:quinone reductase-like Zn-dependent oxidoreductase